MNVSRTFSLPEHVTERLDGRVPTEEQDAYVARMLDFWLQVEEGRDKLDAMTDEEMQQWAKDIDECSQPEDWEALELAQEGGRGEGARKAS